MYYYNNLKSFIDTQKVIILEGSYGKKTLIKEILCSYDVIYMEELYFNEEIYNPLQKIVIVTLENNYEKLREYFNYGKIGKTVIKNTVIIKYGKVKNGERMEKIYKIRVDDNKELRLYYENIVKNKIDKYQKDKIDINIKMQESLMIIESEYLKEKRKTVDLKEVSIKTLKKFIKYYDGNFLDVLLHFCSSLQLTKNIIKEMAQICILRKENIVLYSKRLCGKRKFIESIIREGNYKDTCKVKSISNINLDDVQKNMLSEELKRIVQGKYETNHNKVHYDNIQNSNELKEKVFCNILLANKPLKNGYYQIFYSSNFDYHKNMYLCIYNITKYFYVRQKSVKNEFTINAQKITNKYMQEIKELERNINDRNEKIHNLIKIMEKKMINIDSERNEIEVNMRDIERCKAIMNEEIDKCNASKIIIEEEYSKIKVIIKKSEDEIKMINKKYLTELRSMMQPPEIIKMVLHCVYVILENKIEENVFWDILRGYVKKEDFISNVLNFKKNKENISEKIAINAFNLDKKCQNMCEKEFNNDYENKLLKFIDANFFSNANFTYEKANNASKACGLLFKWIEAVYEYNKIENEVKRIRNEVMHIESKVNKNYNDINKKESRMIELQAELNTKENEYKKLQNDIEANKTEQEKIKTKLIEYERIKMILENEVANKKEVKSETNVEINNTVQTIVYKLLGISNDDNVKFYETNINPDDNKEYIVDESIKNITVAFDITLNVFDCVVKRIEYLLALNVLIYIKNVNKNLSIFDDFVKICVNDKNLEKKLRNVAYYKNNVLLLDCNEYKREVYDLLKYQMDNKFCVVLSGNSNKYYKEECIEIEYEEEIENNMVKKYFDYSEIENKINENEKKFVECINQNVGNNYRTDNTEYNINNHVKYNDTFSSQNSNAILDNNQNDLYMIGMELQRLRNEYENAIKIESDKNEFVKIIKKGIEQYKKMNKLFYNFNGYNLSEEIFEKLLCNKIEVIYKNKSDANVISIVNNDKKCDTFLERTCVDEEDKSHNTNIDKLCFDKNNNCLCDIVQDIESFYCWSFNKYERNEIKKYVKDDFNMSEIFTNNFDYLFIIENDEKLNMIDFQKIYVVGTDNKEIENEMNKIVSIKDKTIYNEDIILVKNIHLDKSLRKRGNQRFVFTVEKNCEFHEIMKNVRIVHLESMNDIGNILNDVINEINKEIEKYYGISDTIDNRKITTADVFGYSEFLLEKHYHLVLFFCYMKYLKNFSLFVINENYEFYMKDLFCFSKATENEIDLAVEYIFYNKFIEKEIIMKIYEHIKNKCSNKNNITNSGINLHELVNHFINEYDYTFIKMDLQHVGDYNGGFEENDDGTEYTFVKCKVTNGKVCKSKEDMKYKMKITKNSKIDNKNYLLVIEGNKIYRLYTDMILEWYRFIIIKT